MSKKVRFAIIGGGMIADFHARAMAEISDIELVGVYEPAAKQAEKFSEKFSIQAFESYDKLLESENIDAVSICTPSGLHASQAILAMQHGKHVVMEKPMAITSEDARMIVDLSRQTGLKVCVISQFRFSPAIQRVKQEIEKGSFGKVVTASLAMNYYRTEEYYNSSDWKGTWAMDGGGALMNQGIHGVDILQYLMGRVSWVMASMDTMTRPIETEDMVVAIMKFQMERWVRCKHPPPAGRATRGGLKFAETRAASYWKRIAFSNGICQLLMRRAIRPKRLCMPHRTPRTFQWKITRSSWRIWQEPFFLTKHPL